MDGHQSAAVATVDSALSYRSHLTDNPRDLLAAIEDIDGAQLPLDPAALRQLSSDSLGSEAHRVLLLSDGGFDQGVLPDAVELRKIGEPLDNVGIVSCDLERLPGSGGRFGFYFRLASSFPNAIDAEVTLSHADDGRIARVIPVRVVPGVNPPEVYHVEGAETGRWLARVTTAHADRLGFDDVAHLVVHEPRPIPVRVVADNPYFFEHTVLAFSKSSDGFALIDTTPTSDDAPPDAGEPSTAAVVIASGDDPDAELAVIFAPEGDSPWWEDLGDEIDRVVPRVITADHPVVRYCDALGVPFAGARRCQAPPGAVVVVESEDGVPLVWVAHREGRGACVFNTDPRLAEFFLSAWFPVLVHGAVTHLIGREEGLAASYPTGRALRVPGARDGEITRVRDPGGLSGELDGDAFGPLERTGFWELSNASGHWAVGSSLFAAEETLLDNAATVDSSRPIEHGPRPASILLQLALVVLVVESLLYQRRKVG